MTPKVLVLGGYGAVGRHAAGTLAQAGVEVVVGGRRRAPAAQLASELGATAEVIDASSASAIRAAAEHVDAVLNCSGRESIDLVDAVLEGGAHLVDVSATYGFQRAAARRARQAVAGELEVLLSVGIAPGLTNLLAVELDVAQSSEPVELVVVLGVGEDHGRAARDWVYRLLGHGFPDTTGQRRLVRNFSQRAVRTIPGMGTCWTYRVDFSDQHVLTADLGKPVITRHGFDSRLATALMAASGRVPGASRALRVLEPVVPWSRLGSDQWVVTAGRGERVERWVAGRNQSRATGVVAGLSMLTLLDRPVPGITHLHQRTTLESLAPQLARHGMQVAR